MTTTPTREQAKRRSELQAHAKFIRALVAISDAYYDLWSASYDGSQQRPYVEEREWGQWSSAATEWNTRATEYATELGVDALLAMPCVESECDADNAHWCFVHDVALSLAHRVAGAPDGLE